MLYDLQKYTSKLHCLKYIIPNSKFKSQSKHYYIIKVFIISGYVFTETHILYMLICIIFNIYTIRSGV